MSSSIALRRPGFWDATEQPTQVVELPQRQIPSDQTQLGGLVPEEPGQDFMHPVFMDEGAETVARFDEPALQLEFVDEALEPVIPKELTAGRGGHLQAWLAQPVEEVFEPLSMPEVPSSGGDVVQGRRMAETVTSPVLRSLRQEPALEPWPKPQLAPEPQPSWFRRVFSRLFGR